MNPADLLKPLLANLPLLLLLVAMLVPIAILRSPAFKGAMGEARVRRVLERLDPARHAAFHDLYLPHPDSTGSTQIDHVVVSEFGIFVIETKNHRGWIFGGEAQRTWTQQIYRRKERFQNPLHQNRLHVRALMALLDLPERVFQSVVVFAGGAEFKTPMPSNVLNSGLKRWIEGHRDGILAPEQVAAIRSTLATLDRDTDRKTAARHHRRELAKRLRKA